MKIFNAFMKVLLKRLNSSLIYVVIFISIGFAMTKSSSSEKEYENVRLNISVTDLDDTAASREVIEFIKKGSDLVDIGSSREEQTDALYYQKADVILTIEKGFSDRLKSGETEELFKEYSVPGTYSTELFDSQLNRYINMINVYISSGETVETASLKASSALSAEVETIMYNDNNSENNTLSKPIYFFFKYLAYIFTAVLTTGLCPIILAMNKKKIRMRVNCSSITTNNQLLQTTLGTLVFVAGLFLVIMTAAAILYKSELFSSHGLLAMLNAIVLIIVTMTICLLISVLAPTEKSISMISNVISLGMSFLCGVFVPQNLLGNSAANLGKLLPAFWYVKATNIIGEKEGEVFSSGSFFNCLAVQLAFAAAIFAVSLVIAKNKRQSRS